MSDEFLKIARSEIQSEINSLKNIFLACTNDEQFHNKSAEIEKHMHKIKGLAPMMDQDKVGEISRICDIILKYTISQGEVKGAYNMISGAVQMMNSIFNENTNMPMEDFLKKTRTTFPQIKGI